MIKAEEIMDTPNHYDFVYDDGETVIKTSDSSLIKILVEYLIDED